MRTKNIVEQTSQLENIQFDLKLPPEIDIKPWAVVEMPRNKQAWVYETKNYGEHSPPIQYSVYIVSKKSLSTMADTQQHYHFRTNVFNDIPSLKHYLLDAAKQMSVKKRTRKIVDVQDLQEADDDE